MTETDPSEILEYDADVIAAFSLTENDGRLLISDRLRDENLQNAVGGYTNYGIHEDFADDALRALLDELNDDDNFRIDDTLY